MTGIIYSDKDVIAFDDIDNSLNILEPGKVNVSVASGGHCCASKKWFRVAIAIGLLIVIGVGGFGILGLLQSHGLLRWLASAIGTIGHTPQFWSLWAIAGGGLTVGGVLISIGAYQLSKKSVAISLDDVPTSSTKLHQITWKLKAPFNYCASTAISLVYPLEGTLGQKIGNVIKRMLKSLAVILLFIPSCLSYGLGAICSSKFDTPRIDTSMLHVAPLPLPPLNKELDYDLEILSKWFEEEMSGGKYQTEFNSMITNIKEENPAILKAHQALPESFYEDMTLYLRNIIDVLIDETNKNRRKDVLKALVEAANVCPPTWYEEAKKQLRLLISPNVGEVQLLHWIQDIKEESILHFIQNILDLDWHALNHVRHHVGEELGLNREGLKNDKYFQREEDSLFTKSFIIALFKANFHTENLLNGLQMKINENYKDYFYDMLKDAMSSRGAKDANAYVSEHFYEEDYKTMTQNGVIMLLKIIGLLK